METGARIKSGVSLKYATVAARPDGLIPAACLNCHNPLDLHQPDSEQPDRMLGTCNSCKRWHLVDFGPEWTSVLVIMLPGPEEFHA